MSATALKLVGDDEIINDLVAPAEPASTGVWLSIDEASKRSKLSTGHLKRQCKKLWSPKGLARKARSESGQEVWVVSELADPLLAGVKFPEQLTHEFRLADLPEKLQRIVLDRERAVLEHQKDRAAGVRLGLSRKAIDRRFVETAKIRFGMEFSPRTLKRWAGNYRRLGRGGLVDGRIEKDEDAETHDDFRQYFMQLFLHPNKRGVTLCYDHAVIKAQESGWTHPKCDRTCRRWVAALDPRVVTLMRDGPKASKDQHQTFHDRSYESLASNDIWCGDHHNFDVLVRVGKDKKGKPVHARPWITAWEDLRSRKIVGWMIGEESGNTDTIIAAFVNGAETHGLPWRVYIDNGKDYDAKALQGETKQERRTREKEARALARKSKTVPIEIDRRHIGGVWGRFQIDVTHALPYNAQAKPIERAFGTVCGRFSKLWDTYCGRNPQEKPHGLQDRLDKGMAPTLGEFTAAFATWLESDYHGRRHLGDAMNGDLPSQAFEANLHQKRVTPSREELLIGAMPRVVASVHQNGVRRDKLFYGANTPELMSYVGRKVHIAIDPNDRKRIFCFEPDGRFLCRAELNYKPDFALTNKQVRAANADMNRSRKVIRELDERRPRLAADMLETLQHLHAKGVAEQADDRGNDSPPPGTMLPVRVVPDEQREQIRKAVGAESVDPIQPMPARGGVFRYSPTFTGSESEGSNVFNYGSSKEAE